MKLLQEIIDQAVDEKAPIGALLRRCLVLERKIKNEKFRQWRNWELDGYFNGEELPTYRKFQCVNQSRFGNPSHDSIRSETARLVTSRSL
jgi:hypothetical protein